MNLRRALVSVSAVGFVSSLVMTASAFPGFFAYRGQKPVNLSTHVVLMKKDPITVVSVMPDYEGDLKPFAVVMPVPDDVKAAQVRTLRRDFVDRVDQISAPRFHEFWEMDPCDPGKLEQEWERDLSVHGGGFLGMDFGSGASEPTAFKPGKEMGIAVLPEFKSGEQKFSIVPNAEAADIAGWLEKRGYSSPDGVDRAVAPYVKAGMQFLVAEIDTKKVELTGSDRAVISPIRYVTNEPVTIASTLGLLNAKDKQELFIYVLDPARRFEVKNYANAFPPTNIEVDFKVKERLGEFYATLHDVLLKKAPLTFLDEYAWPTTGCGQPCTNEPLMLSELLTLGGDAFEDALPKAEREPKPPDMTDDEKKAFKEIKDAKQKKQIEQDRKESARRRAMIARNHYMLSRMHFRYDKTTLPKDVEVGPGDQVEGGIGTPNGPKATLPLGVKPATVSRFQTRFVSFHPSPAVTHCDKPERYRWGKSPRTYLGLRKIWTAQDLATKNRTNFKLAEVVYTPVPALAIAGQPALLGGVAETKSFLPQPAPSASATSTESDANHKTGSCSVEHGTTPPSSGGWALLAAGFCALLRRRRSIRKGGLAPRGSLRDRSPRRLRRARSARVVPHL